VKRNLRVYSKLGLLCKECISSFWRSTTCGRGMEKCGIFSPSHLHQAFPISIPIKLAWRFPFLRESNGTHGTHGNLWFKGKCSVPGQTYGHLSSYRMSPLSGRYRIIYCLMRGSCVWTTWPKSIRDNKMVGSRSSDFFITHTDFI